MRSRSLFIIIALCLGILFVDILAFYGLRSITRLITSDTLRYLIHILFWFFTIALITAIFLLRTRLRKIHPRQRQRLTSSLYGLTVSSLIPKLIFVLVLGLLYFTNFIFPAEQFVIIMPVIGLISGFFPFFVIVYGIFRTLYRFKIHRIHINFKNLPESFHGLRITHISDLHLGSFNFRYHILDRAVRMINQLKPDLIFFTGDLVNNYEWELKGWDNVLKRLQAKRGKYSVLGNHDYGDYGQWASAEDRLSNFEAIKDFHRKIGFTLLRNETELMKSGGEKIAISGVENWGKPPFKQYGDLEKTLENTRDIPFKILLSHDPSHWSEEVLRQTDIALTLSGHTHGMQAGISFKSRQWSPIQYKYRHWAGLYRSGDQYLYVNRGLGWMGFPGRLGIRPEITLIELRKSGSRQKL